MPTINEYVFEETKNTSGALLYYRLINPVNNVEAFNINTTNDENGVTWNFCLKDSVSERGTPVGMVFLEGDGKIVSLQYTDMPRTLWISVLELPQRTDLENGYNWIFLHLESP